SGPIPRFPCPDLRNQSRRPLRKRCQTNDEGHRRPHGIHESVVRRDQLAALALRERHKKAVIDGLLKLLGQLQGTRPERDRLKEGCGSSREKGMLFATRSHVSCRSNLRPTSMAAIGAAVVMEIPPMRLLYTDGVIEENRSPV